MDKEKLLADEYFHLQARIENFQRQSFAIKAWSVSFSFAAIGAAFVEGSSFFLLGAAASAIIFWIIETYWRTYEVMHYKRNIQLEEYFRGEIKSLNPLQINTVWQSEYDAKLKRKFKYVFLWPDVALPHALPVFIGVVLFILHLSNLISL